MKPCPFQIAADTEETLRHLLEQAREKTPHPALSWSSFLESWNAAQEYQGRASGSFVAVGESPADYLYKDDDLYDICGYAVVIPRHTLDQVAGKTLQIRSVPLAGGVAPHSTPLLVVRDPPPAATEGRGAFAK